MKTANVLMTCATLVLALALTAGAQTDHFGAADTVYAEVHNVNDMVWSVTINYTNDQNVVGLSIPFKMSSGTTRLVADSAVYTGGRVEHFDLKAFRPDTAIQCVTLGMIANMGPSDKVLAPGHGRIVTVFVSSLEDKPIEDITVDTTTTSPDNSLMVVADQMELKRMLEEEPSQLDERIQIFPAFVVRHSK